MVLSGRELPSPTVRDSDLAKDHPPPAWMGGTLTDANDSPAVATAAETLALIAWAAVDDDARMFEVRSERMGKDDDVGGEGRLLPPPSTDDNNDPTTPPPPPLVPARLEYWKVVAMEPAIPPIMAFQGLPPEEGGGG